MKAVLISIRPQWCEKITSGKKTIEVRKSAPKEVPFKAYIYCTKGKDGYEWLYRVDNNGYGKAQSWHGKVIGEFICDKVFQWKCKKYLECDGTVIYRYFPLKPDLDKSCLTFRQFHDYGCNKTLYGWHISDLKIYDKPKELSEFKISCNRKNPCCSCCNRFTGKPWDICNSTITRPPQSWQFVEELEK